MPALELPAVSGTAQVAAGVEAAATQCQIASILPMVVQEGWAHQGLFMSVGRIA